MPEPLSSVGRVAVVTGAGAVGGLGRAHALVLAAQGCRVVVNDVGLPFGDDVPAAEQVAAEIRAAGGDAVADTHDVVTDAAGIVATALEAFGGVDIVVNNAGIGASTPIGPDAVDEWRRTIDISLTGSIAVTGAAWRAPRALGVGSGGDDGVEHDVRRGPLDGVLHGQVGDVRPHPLAGRGGPPLRHRRELHHAGGLDPPHRRPPARSGRRADGGHASRPRRWRRSWRGCATRRARCRARRSASAAGGPPGSCWPRPSVPCVDPGAEPDGVG